LENFFITPWLPIGPFPGRDESHPYGDKQQMRVFAERKTTMFSLTVLYEHPTDPAEFDRYYNEVHTPLVQKIKGLKGLSVIRFKPGPHGEKPPYYLMAVLHADSAEAFNAAMSSPEGRAASADVANFAANKVIMIPGDETYIDL
jgi:uncharacterized protein (TIGR02118 family)